MPWVGCSGNLSSGAQSCGATSSETDHHGALHSEVQCHGAMLQERQWDCSEQPERSHRAPAGSSNTSRVPPALSPLPEHKEHI